MDKPLAVYEICAKLGLGRSSVYSLLRSGQIPSRRIGLAEKRYLVTQANVETYMKKCIERTLVYLEGKDHDQTGLRGKD
jgi:excisionase family DNA binding protein